MSTLSHGENSLQTFDKIKYINNHPLNSLQDWSYQLQRIATQSNGLCVSSQVLKDYELLTKTSNLCNFEDCCQKDDGANLCFLIHADSEQPISKCPSLRDEMVNSNLNAYFMFNQADFVKNHKKVCLPARHITEIASSFCNHNHTRSKCADTYFGSSICVMPYSSHRQTRLIVIGIHRQGTNKRPILFFGPPAELKETVKLSDVEPRFRFIPISIYDQMNIFLR